MAKTWIAGCVGWSAAIVLFFPIFWMALTAFKTEAGAYAGELWFRPTLDSFRAVFARSDYLAFAWNSICVSVGSTLLCFLVAIPAAYRMTFFATRRTKGTLVWMLSTKMMPSVGVLLPVYLLMKSIGWLDSVVGLIVVYALMNLPIAVWMCYTYFCEVPVAVLEASRVDGAGVFREMREILGANGIAGDGFYGFAAGDIGLEREFWSINLTSAKAATLPVFIASYSSPEGLFWAKLSAASLLAVAPILAMGWLTQKQLVSGLTFGAVK